MGMLDRLKGAPPSAEALQEKLNDALEAQAAADAAYREACLVASDGGAADQKKRTEAEKRLDRANRDVRELEAALEAARQYETEAAEKATADDTAQRWATVNEHVTAREKAAKDAEAAVAKLADAMDRIAEANTGILNAAPKRLDVSGALVGAWDTEAALRLHLLKAGFRWASTWPWGPESVPSFGSRIGEANAYVRSVSERAGR